MSNYVNLMDIVYPVGAVYFSTSPTSPASIIGGTWERIKDAVIGCIGDTYKAALNGNKKITKYQLPEHQHIIRFINQTNIDALDAGTDCFTGKIAGYNDFATNMSKDTLQTIRAYNNSASGSIATKDGDLYYRQTSGNTSWVIPLYAASLVNNVTNGGGAELYSIQLWLLCMEKNCLIFLKKVMNNE